MSIQGILRPLGFHTVVAITSRGSPRSETKRRGPNARRRTELGLLLFGSLIVVAAYVLASIGTTSKIPPDLGPFLGIVIGLALLGHLANRFLAPDANPVLLPIAALLNGLGYVMLAVINEPQYYPLQYQAAWTAVGMGMYLLTLLVVRRSRDLDRYRYILLLIAVFLMLSPLIPHIGESVAISNGSSVRLFVKIGPVSGQPVEIAKILFCIFFASYFSEKRELLAIPTVRLGNRLVLDPRPLVPILLAWAFAMLVLAVEHDIGFALLIFVLFISMLWLTTGRARYMVFGLGLFALGAYVANKLFSQVGDRVANWLHPMSRINVTGGSDQLVQGLYGLGTGGLTGTGLGFGQANLNRIPEVGSDYIFAAIGTEWGLLGTTMVMFAYLLIFGAGLRIAQTARSDFGKLLATGLTVILGVQAFVIMAGIANLLPFTGLTLPFMAYGGSSLVANYVLIAILMRISDEGERAALTADATATRLTDQGKPDEIAPAH
jgi:cell division protein FtsW (lipid II flippase)